MTAIRMLLGVLGLLAVVGARPQFGPVYSYRFDGPDQTKEESRDVLGNIQGSYSVTYPDNGGTLTYSYSHRAAQPAFRTLSDSAFGPAGTVIAIGKQNSKISPFLIEMKALATLDLDSRNPPIVTKTDAVLIEALPAKNEAPVTKVRFQAAQTGEKSGPPRPNQVRVAGPALTRLGGGFINSKESLTRLGGGFINSKESAFLPGLREESFANEELGARSPPLITDEAIIVDALPTEV